MAFLSATARRVKGGRYRPLGLWLGVVSIMLAGGLDVSAQAPVSREYQIKAAFLFNFAQFVEWPASAFDRADAPLAIGILGDDPFDGVLEEIVQGETLRGHKLIVHRSRRAEDLKDCQLVFISKSEKEDLPGIISKLKPATVLTVSEIEGFAQNGGVINFYREGKKVRFEINPKAARREGLKISSQLLSLGRIVDTDSKNGYRYP